VARRHHAGAATFDGINPPAWTLSVEAQLYLAYPVVFWLTARLGALRALGVVLAITMAYRLTLTAVPLPPELAGPAWVVFVARWFEWALGATVAEWAAGGLRLPRALGAPSVGLAVLGAAVAVEWHTGTFGLYVIKEPLYGMAFALLLYGALLREPAGSSSVAGRYLADVGLYSYSLYLLHRPIPARAGAARPLGGDLAGRDRRGVTEQPGHHGGEHADRALGLAGLLPVLRGVGDPAGPRRLTRGARRRARSRALCPA
jgi:peptidoglycan/LPS O-acetylase OafA/YrhL